jgi:sugar phosphate isomerase/epimerase
MKLLLARHLWGVDLSAGLDQHVEHWRNLGYEAIEAAWSELSSPALRLLLQRHGMAAIAQVSSGSPASGDSGDVPRHLTVLRRQVEACSDLSPLFISVHGGSDAWSYTQAEDFYGGALELEQRAGIRLAHETHRGRYFNNPWATAAILRRFPALQLTCDFSHWVCVTERLLEDCGALIDLAARHCLHLHARVGYEEGPQVPDPRAPEWSQHLAAHEAWWDKIWAAQQSRGLPLSTLTPEFGPPPYLHTAPFTQTPVADLPAICDWMALRQRERFQSGHGGGVGIEASGRAN